MQEAAYRFYLDEEMLSPMLEMLLANLREIFPILLAIFGVLLCVRVIPPLLSWIMRL